jgi:hypothetical protein
MLPTTLLIFGTVTVFGIIGWCFGYFEGKVKHREVNGKDKMERYRKEFNL